MRSSARCLLASVAIAATVVGVVAPASGVEAADTCGGVVFADLDGDGNRR